MVKRYAPILKAKAGEFKAIKELNADVLSRVAPMFDVEQPDPGKGISATSHIAKVATSLRKCGPPSVFFVDAFSWPADAEVETGEHVYSFLVSMLRAEGLAPVPTIGYDRWGSAEYRLAIQNIGAGPNGMWAIRLDRSVFEDMYDQDLVRETIEDMLATVDADPSNVVIFIDLEDLSAPQFSVAALYSDCEDLVQALSDFQFRAFVIAGSSMPPQINFAVPTPNSTTSMPRKEQLVWRALRANFPTVPIISGDYGVRGPTSYSGPNKHMNGKVRYSTDRTFFIARGHSINLDGSYVQMHALAQAVVASGHYRGPAYSWGDQKIAQAAAGQFTGNMSSWIAVDTNHHTHAVVDEVIGFELTLNQVAVPAL